MYSSSDCLNHEERTYPLKVVFIFFFLMVHSLIEIGVLPLAKLIRCTFWYQGFKKRDYIFQCTTNYIIVYNIKKTHKITRNFLRVSVLHFYVSALD